MRWLIVMMLAFVVGATGCGSKRKDSGAESFEGGTQADTANIDPSGSTEVLPAIDQPNEVADAAQSAPDQNGAVNNIDAAASPSSVDAVAGATPTPTPDPAVENSQAPTSSAGTGQMTDYSVQKGDTLMKIAFNLYGDISQWKNIFEWNKEKLSRANQLLAGMNLKYDKPVSEPSIERNGDPYLIKKGDTLGIIADDVYAKKSKWKKLYENNRGLIKDPNRIYAGFYLYYQITEEEKKEAEEIKARRGSGQQMSNAENLPDSAANTFTGGDSLKGGGLNILAAPPSNGHRVPAGTSK